RLRLDGVRFDALGGESLEPTAFPGENWQLNRLGSGWPDALRRAARYTLLRLISLGATVAVGVYLAIVLANMGGKVDEIRRAMIREQVTMQVSFDQELSALS